MFILMKVLTGVTIKGRAVGLVKSTSMDFWQIAATSQTTPGPLLSGDLAAYLDSRGNWSGYMACKDFFNGDSALACALLHADKIDTPIPYDEIDQDEN